LALDCSIDNSWYAHEGVASASELASALSIYGDEVYSYCYNQLELEYQNAVEPFLNIFRTIELPVIMAGPVITAFGHIAFDTNIAVDMLAFNDFITNDWDLYFSKLDKSPDLRLNYLFNHVINEDILLKLKKHLFAYAEEMFAVNNISVQEMFDKYIDVGYEKQLVFSDVIVDKTVSYLLPYLPFSLDNYNVDPFAPCQKMISSWNGYFKNNNINNKINIIFKNFENNYDMRRDHALNINYEEKNQTTDCINMLYNDRLMDALKDSGICFYIHFLFNPSKYTEIIDDKNVMKLTPGGGYFRVHVYYKDKKSNLYEFLGPFGEKANADLKKPFAFVVGKNKLKSCLKKMRTLPHIMSMVDISGIYNEKYSERYLLKAIKYPIIIITNPNTLTEWKRIIESESGCSIYQKQIGISKTKLLVVVYAETMKIYAAPTSDLVVNRIYELYGSCAVNSITDIPQCHVSLEEALDIFAQHYTMHEF